MARSPLFERRRSFGVTWAPGGVAFLMQDDGVTNALGVDIPCPFPQDAKRVCPHQIRIPAVDAHHHAESDPLFQALSPVPGSGTYLIRHDREVIENLLELCSLKLDVIEPLWIIGRAQLRSRLLLTNCAPLVLTDVTLEDIPLMRQFAHIARTLERRVVFLSSCWMPAVEGIPTIKSQIDTIYDPTELNAVGASMLTRYMLDPPTT